MPLPSLVDLRAMIAAGPPYDPGLLDALRADARAGARDLLRRVELRLARAADEHVREEACLSHERAARERGYARVAGVDEAGRGPLAGPIVAAAVILGGPIPPGLNDSKKLIEPQREALFDALHAGDHAIGVAIVEPTEIDARGIQSANMQAMCEAVQMLKPLPDYLLVDGFRLPGAPCPHERMIRGDARSLSIAAASIVAKVTRDRIMTALDETYPGYGFARHKGYGTRDHLEAIARLGPCPAHRRSFAPIARVPEQTELPVA